MLMEKDVSSAARSCSRKLIAVTFSASLWMMVLVHMVVMGFGNTFGSKCSACDHGYNGYFVGKCEALRP
jgi:hypothetical protein